MTVSGLGVSVSVTVSTASLIKAAKYRGGAAISQLPLQLLLQFPGRTFSTEYIILIRNKSLLLKKHTESGIEKAGNSKYMKHETGRAVSC